MSTAAPSSDLDDAIPADRVRRAAWALTALTVVMWTLMAVCGWRAEAAHGRAGFQAAAASYGLMWLSAVSAMILLILPRIGNQKALAVLAGILMRTVMPLAVAVAILEFRPDLVAAGVKRHLVTAYLVMLLLESSLAVWVLDPTFQAFKNPRVDSLL